MELKIQPKFYDKIIRRGSGSLPPGIPNYPPALDKLLSWVKGVNQGPVRLDSAQKLGNYPLTITEHPGVYFSDQTCYFVHPVVSLGSRPFTIKFKIRLYAGSEGKYIMASSFGRGDVRVSLDLLGFLNVYWYDANGISYRAFQFGVNVVDEQLYTVEIIKDATSLRLKILEADVDVYVETSTDWYSSGRKLAIGADQAASPTLANSAYFKLYDLEINGSKYYFCEGSGDIVFDASGNGLHLTKGPLASTDTVWTTTTDSFKLIEKGFSARENLVTHSEDMSAWTLVGTASVSGNTVSISADGDGISQSGLSDKQGNVSGVTMTAAVDLDGTAGETVVVRLDDGIAPVEETVTLPGVSNLSITTDATATDVTLSIVRPVGSTMTQFVVNKAHVFSGTQDPGYAKSDDFAVKGYQVGVTQDTDALGGVLQHRSVFWNEAPVKYQYDPSYTDMITADAAWNFWYDSTSLPIQRHDSEFNFDTVGFGQYFFKAGSKVGLAVYNQVLTGADRALARAYFEEVGTLGTFVTTASTPATLDMTLTGNTWTLEQSSGITRGIADGASVSSAVSGEFYVYADDPTSLAAPGQYLDWTYVPKLPRSLINVNLIDNALSQTASDNLLINLDRAGAYNGTVDISGGTNSAPGATGLLARARLESKGWTIVDNSPVGALELLDSTELTDTTELI